MNNFEGSKLPFPLPLPTINIYNTLKEQECAICLDPLLCEESSSHLRQLTCGHTYHNVCLIEAKSDGRSSFYKDDRNPCPFCRETIQRVGELFIDEKGNAEKVQINLGHGRGGLKWGILIVDENTKMKKIMEICCQMLGQDTTYSPNDQPRPFLESKYNFQYSPSSDLNEDLTLQAYGIKNGDSITVSHTFKYV